MEAAQPPVVSVASAAQSLRNTVSTEALLASGNAAPSWTQRLRFDLAPMIAAVAPTHQSMQRPPAPYYPAPDTGWSKDAAVIEEAPAEVAATIPEPQAIVAEPAPILTAAVTPELLTPPVAQPAEAAPAEAPETEAPVGPAVASDSASDTTTITPMSPAQPAPVEAVAAAEPAPAPAPAVDARPASPALVATLNWVYGDTTATLPAEDTQAAAEPSAADAEPQPASPSLAMQTPAFDTNVELPGEKRVIEVRRGDTLFGLLTKAGVSDAEAQAASHSLADVFSPSDLKIGQEITLNFATDAGQAAETDNKLVALTLQPSVERDVKLTRDADGQFIAASIDKPLTERVDRAAGQIDISLFESAHEAGVPVGMIGDIIKAYSYDVDFQRDIHEGDSFEVMYERFDNEKGEFAKAGRLLYASLLIGGKPMPIYYFERDGDGEYFTADGVAVRKSLLKTPIDGAKITSGYGMRVNPILGYSAMHQGIDFGAPTGTPIFAAGNGTIEEIGWKNGFGNYIKLRHNGTYETAYAHSSRFASGLRKGMKVKQGQVIAYVGTTGRSTGPHLHFEIIVDGQHVNPSTVKTVASDKLGGSDLKAFKTQVAKIQSQRREIINRAEIADQSGSAPTLDCNRQRGCLN